MFTGFASENTPAIQVWDFFRTFASTSAVRSVTLADDCAPIQVFRTGATGNSAIRVYLPTAPIEGKQITIVNQQFGSASTSIQIYSSDVNATGTTSPIHTCGQAGSIVLVYSKQTISFGINVGDYASGWLTLNQGSVGSASSGSAIVGGTTNAINAAGGFIGGGSSNAVTSTYGAVVGGLSNTASGQYAAVVGGSSNTASNSYSATVGGSSNTASGQSSAVVGGETSASSGTYSAILGGSFNTANATNASVVGGQSNTANSNSGIVAGGRSGTTRLIQGNTVLPASAAPISATAGVQQLATLLLGRQTTDATATVLASNSSAASTTNQVILPNNSAYTFQGTCIANVTGGGNTSGWKFEGVIKRGANAASTALVAAVTPTVIAQDAGASTWVLAITADTTNGGIAVTVTGQAATTIRWVVQIETTEVTF
jgi:hypothetical protein